MPVTRAEVGTTLTAVPALSVPALHTQLAPSKVSPSATSPSRPTSSAVARMTSPWPVGMAPWPPGPVSVTRNEWASDIVTPPRTATRPVGIWEVTWNPTRREPSMAASAPFSIMVLAPQSASSAGWKTNT